MFPFQSQYKEHLLNSHVDKSIRVTDRQYNQGMSIERLPNIDFYGNDESIVKSGANCVGFTNLVTGGIANPGIGPSGIPTFQTAGLNGRDTVKFTAASSQFMTWGSTILGKPSNFTIIAVVKINSVAATRTFCASGPSSGASNAFWGNITNLSTYQKKVYYNHSVTGVSASNGVTNDDVWVAGSFVIITTTYTAGDDYQRVYSGYDLKAVTKIANASTANSGTAYNFTIGRGGDFTSSGYFDGEMAAFAIARRVLTDAERNLCIAILKSRYNL